MAFRIEFPGTRKKALRRDDRQEAIAEAVELADKHTVEVWEGEPGGAALLARYDRRAEPLHDTEEG